MLRLVTLAAVACSLLASGCGGGEGTVTVYFEKPGSAAAPLQVVPLVAPTTRRIPDGTPLVPAVLAALEQGPSSDEIRDGFLPTAPLDRRVLAVERRDNTAVVDLSGRPLDDFDAHAALVFTLTSLPGIDRVVLLSHGKPCCVHDMQGGVVSPLTRDLYRGWAGEPCDARTYADAVRCRPAGT
ncbi:MAG: GerMN domain-containing protein [Actinobacteria bacterium]|nr:MAG: GerMN domain-containing protein [Actinomycetota bacterium]